VSYGNNGIEKDRRVQPELIEGREE